MIAGIAGRGERRERRGSAPAPDLWNVGPRPAYLFVLLVVCALAAGCGAPKTARSPEGPRVERGGLLELHPGQAFYFVEHFTGGKAPPEVRRGADGANRVAFGEAHQPVLCAPAPYVFRQQVRVPAGAALRTGFGVVPGGDSDAGGGVRFSVRLGRAGGAAELFSAEVKAPAARESQAPQTVVIDLSDAAGEEVEIELATAISGAGEAAASENGVGARAVWIDPTLVPPTDRPPPNIVLIVVDALRPDHLGCYGYSRETSPFLDGLADEGVLFEDATAQATWTFASVASLLSSSYRIARGSHPDIMSQLSSETEEELSDLRPIAMPVSIQSELRRAGYTTLACVGGGYLDPILGFDSGFGWYWSPQRPGVLADQLSVLKRRLTTEPQAPFFLLLHTYEVHNYFQGLGHCLDQFDRGYLGPLTDQRKLEEAALRGTPDALAPGDLQYIHDLYDGEILHTDRYLGTFLEWLLEQPWGKNSIIAVTADHGESLGDNDAMSHGGTPYQSQARVPLIVRLPDGRRRGRHVAQPVALVDMMPTLLELAGSAPPEGLAGRSLVPLMNGSSGSDTRPVFSESRGADLLAREGTWCYLGKRGEREEELYDIERDPGQTENLSASQPRQLVRMRGVLAALAARAARGYHLAVGGPRSEEIVIELQSDGGFSYLTVPTLQRADELAVTKPISERSRDCRVEIKFSAGDTPHVVLFEPADPRARVTVAAHMGGEPVGAGRFHLGPLGTHPDRTPVTVSPSLRPILTTDEPPLSGVSEPWGIWLWLPGSAAHAMAAAPAAQTKVPEGLRDTLRALGYLK
ncbi:MAG: sulfatase [Armatimonadota bacterium]|nr:MAG: sulfatase [Armatimonadota bacterium]